LDFDKLAEYILWINWFREL